MATTKPPWTSPKWFPRTPRLGRELHAHLACRLVGVHDREGRERGADGHRLARQLCAQRLGIDGHGAQDGTRLRRTEQSGGVRTRCYPPRRRLLRVLSAPNGGDLRAKRVNHVLFVVPMSVFVRISDYPEQAVGI